MIYQIYCFHERNIFEKFKLVFKKLTALFFLYRNFFMNSKMSNQCEIKQKYILSYFNVKGIAEPIRLLLSYGKIDFVDRRIPKAEWPKVKASEYYSYLNYIYFNVLG